MDSQKKSKRYWFAAKRYGYGWGSPSTWEGWLFLLGWLAIMFVGAPWLATYGVLLILPFIIVMIVVLLVVHFIKGEPLGWRWGEKD